MPIDEIRRRLDEQSQKNDEARRQIEKKRQEADGLEQGVKKQQARRPDVGASRKRLDRARAGMESSREAASQLDEDLRRLGLLEDQLQREESQGEQVRKEAEELKKTLTQRMREVNAKREGIAKIKREAIRWPIVHVGGAPLFSMDERKPVYIMLSLGTVTPVGGRHYSITQSGDVQEAKMISRGAAVDQALSEGSDFQKLLGGIDTTTHYVYLLVDSLSFETFRAVREELRRREIPMGWAPTDATVIRFVASGGVQPGVTN
jgi:hypothetical protein